MKVAVVDLGTNTCRLFLAEVREDGHVITVQRQTTVVRLGQGVDVNRRLQPQAIRRTRACLQEYAPRLEAFGPARRLLVATSVLRDALDGPAFLATAERDFGLPFRVLAGEEEAALAFRGGTAELGDRRAGPLVLIDIGGGSTEFAVGEPGRAPTYVCSLDVGAVRLTERFIRHDPPTPVEIGDLGAFVAEAIARGVPATVRGAARAAVGVAGTYTTLAAYKLALRTYRPELVHGHALSLADIEAAIGRFDHSDQRRARCPARHPAGPRRRHSRGSRHRGRGLSGLWPGRGALQRGRSAGGRGAGSGGRPVVPLGWRLSPAQPGDCGGACVYFHACRSGGIGRRRGLKILCPSGGVWVRSPPSAPVRHLIAATLRVRSH